MTTVAQTASDVQVWHAVIGSLSGVLAPGPDGTIHFFDPIAQETYIAGHCPPITVQAPVARQMVPHILEQMRAARFVDLGQAVTYG